MSRPIIQIHDVSTGEEIIREMNDVEFAQYQASQPTESQRAESVRAERNQKLKETDWTQLDDSPGQSKLAWATYRQALRDVPEQTGFPWEVQWPNEPENLS